MSDDEILARLESEWTESERPLHVLCPRCSSLPMSFCRDELGVMLNRSHPERCRAVTA